MKLLALLIITLFIASCASVAKRETVQTVTTTDAVGKPVKVVTTTKEALPKDIAHKEQTIAERATCYHADKNGDSGTVNLRLIKPMELKSGAAQAEYIEAVSDAQLMEITKMAIAGMMGNPEVACQEAITRADIAYYKMEAQRSSYRWSFGKFLSGAVATAYSVDSIVGAVSAAGAVGDSYVGELNISGTSSGGAGGGEGVAGLGGALDQNINIGNGTQNRAGGNLNFGEKPINGNDNNFQDNDGGNTAKLF